MHTLLMYFVALRLRDGLLIVINEYKIKLLIDNILKIHTFASVMSLTIESTLHTLSSSAFVASRQPTTLLLSELLVLAFTALVTSVLSTSLPSMAASLESSVDAVALLAAALPRVLRRELPMDAFKDSTFAYSSYVTIIT
jgi:hypothetical protein